MLMLDLPSGCAACTSHAALTRLCHPFLLEQTLYQATYPSAAVERMAVINDKDIGRLVRALRERLELSQERFAARLGVTFSSVNRWENGRTKPSPLAMKQLEEMVDGLGGDGQDLHDEFFSG